MDFTKFISIAPKVIEKFEGDCPKDNGKPKLLVTYDHGMFVVVIPEAMPSAEVYKGVWNQVLSKEPGQPNYAGVYLPKMAVGEGEDEELGDVMFLSHPLPEDNRVTMLLRQEDQVWRIADEGVLSDGKGMAFEVITQVLANAEPFDLMAPIEDPGLITFDGDPIDLN